MNQLERLQQLGRGEDIPAPVNIRIPAIQLRPAKKSAQIISQQQPGDLSEPTIKAAVASADGARQE